jgi:hypothetical protein
LEDSYPEGATHEVLGYEVPVGVDERLLEEIGSAKFLDGNGDDPTEGEGVPPLPADEVAELVASVTAHNNVTRRLKASHANVARAVAIARIWRDDHRSACETLLRHAEHGKLPALMALQASQAIDRMRARLSDRRAWSLWEVASGEILDVETVDDGETETTIVDGGPYVLTRAGESRIGTKEGVLPMWTLVADCGDVDPYDCEDFLNDSVWDALIRDGLVREPDEGAC